jgi:hypothetical protein
MDVMHFRVLHFDGRVEELTAESPNVLVGTGSHCEIRLPIGQGRVEHVLVQATPAGLRASARAFDPPPTIDGVEFTQAPLPPDAEISIGKTRIRAAILSDVGTDVPMAGARGTRATRLYAYVVFGLAACLLMVMARGKAKPALAEPARVPGLWGAPADTCPQSTADEALATARARIDLAGARRERSPFHPEDGVAAVALYQVAAACFRAAGNLDEANDTSAEARDIARALGEDFREHRVRLQRAMAQKEWARAEHEAQVLSTFLANAPGEYADWLAALRRTLVLQSSAKGKS